MEVLNLGRMLYASKCKIQCCGMTVNTSSVRGLYTSRYRRASDTSPVKMSLAASVFDVIFHDAGSLAVYQYGSDDLLYVSMKCGKYECIVSEFKVNWLGNRPENNKYAIIPCILYELLVKEENEELKILFAEVANLIMGGATSFDGSVWTFCDSFYYGSVKRAPEKAFDNTLTDSEIKAFFRGGAQQAEFIGCDVSKYLGKSPLCDDADTVSSLEEYPASTSSMSSFIEDCKEGKYLVPYSWTPEMRDFIISSDYLDSFEPTEIFEEIVKKIKYHADKILERMDIGYEGAEAIGPDALNILMIGKPGTGKTTLAYALSAATGMPVCTTAWNKHSDEDEVEGKTKIIDGKPCFVETNALVFHMNGGINVNEEINLADPSVTMGALGQQLEYPYIVKRNGYEVKVRHPLNVQIATMNVGTNGSNPLNQALANRFKNVFILDDPTKKTFISILMKASGKSSRVCEWVYSAYEKTVNYLKSPEVNEDDIVQNLSIRTCLGALINMDEGQSPKRALINSLVGAVAAVDLEVARNLQREVIEVLPDTSF